MRADKRCQPTWGSASRAIATRRFGAAGSGTGGRDWLGLCASRSSPLRWRRHSASRRFSLACCLAPTARPPRFSGWGVIAAASLLTLVVFERAARRLLPLAALLNLSLIFPDKAPARFAVVRRTGRPADLQESLRRAHETGRDDDARRMQTIIELVLALSVHDKASRGHSERVRVFTDLLADELKVPEMGRNRLRWAALLHDIGKLEVPATILNKPGKPDDDEWAALHRHPEEGARLVAPLLPWLGEWGRPWAAP